MDVKSFILALGARAMPASPPQRKCSKVRRHSDMAQTFAGCQKVTHSEHSELFLAVHLPRVPRGWP